MTPSERTEFEALKKQVQSLMAVENVPFIQNLDRRIPKLIDKSSTTTVTSIIRSVNEAGTASYSVAKTPDRKLGVQLSDGTTVFIGVYNS